MLSTENIGLKKPGYNDEADIAVINENSDIIDREFGNRYLRSETYSVEQANKAIAQAIEALPNGLVYRGAVNYYKDLPTANNELGDTYSVKYQGETETTADGNEYAWGEYDGTLQWIKLGVNAYTKKEIDEQHEIIKNDIAINRTTLGTQCKNLLNITSITQEINGVTITVNSDKSITINGTATKDFYHYINRNADNSDPYIHKGKYIASGGSEQCYVYVRHGINVSGENGTLFSVKDTDVLFTVSNENELMRAFLYLRASTTYNNVTVYPMIRLANITDGAYEPYTPSLQEQINALVERMQALEAAQTQNE